MLILFTGLIGMLNTPTLAETIPITEVFYDYAHPMFEQGIYVIATETNPVEMYPNYTYIKEHATTETSVGAFVSILVSQGIFSSSGYGLEILSIERIDYEFVLTANVYFWRTFVPVFTNPIALIPIGDLPAGEYTINLYAQDVWETWTASFNCLEWITVTSSAVEMSIENKTTPLGEELSILMVAPVGAWLPDAQVFDVYLYDSHYSLFSYWSQNKLFAQMITSVPPGYNTTLKWNLYHYEPYTPPPPGNYYLVGTIMGWEDVTPPIPIRIDESTVQILRSHTRRHCVRIRRHM